MRSHGKAHHYLLGGLSGSAMIGGTALLSAGCSLAAQVLFERALGVDDFARWAFLNALCTTIVPIACMGSHQLLLSEYYAGRLRTRDGSLALLRYFSRYSAVAAILFLGFTTLASPSGPVASIGLLAFLFVAQVLITLVFPVFQWRHQAGWVAAWPLLQVGLRLLLSVTALIAAWRLSSVVLTWAIGSSLLAVVALCHVLPALRLALRRRAQDSIRPNALVRPGLGFGLIELLDSLDIKLLVPLAAFFFEPEAVSAAAIVVVFLSAVHFIPHALIVRILLPALHRENDRTSLKPLLLKLSGWSVVVLTPVSAALCYFGYALVESVARGNYESQSDALSLFGLCVVPLAVSQLGAALFMSRQYMPQLLRWRLEALILLIAQAFIFREYGLTSLIVAIINARVWLSIRVFWELLVTPDAPERTSS